MVKKATNYYQMLGVEPEVTTSEIKKAYRKLAKTYHPDIGHHGQSVSQQTQANEFMVLLNQAYATLIDTRRRAEYDSRIGANGHGRSMRGKHPTATLNEGELREKYLRQIFNPARSAIMRVLAKYKQQLTELSQDIYDDELVRNFEIYVEEIENTLRKSANDLSSRVVPHSMTAAVQMMRYAIAQAVDGLEETQRFCQNYDYTHLHMAGNLFREATDLSRKAQQLTKR